MSKTSICLINSLVINFILSICKVIFGFIGKSSALIADGVHSFSDLATDLVAIFGNNFALKPADKEHPYGHGRLEYLTSLMISFVILFLGFMIIYKTSYTNNSIPSKIVIIVSLFTIISKYILAKYLIKKGKQYNNTILISSGKESSMDVISSIFVLISSILMQFSSEYIILKYSNFVVTIFIGIFIINTGFSILKDSISSILGEQENEKKDEFIKIIQKEEKIIKIDELSVIKNGPYYQVIGEVSMDETLTLKESHRIVDKLERKIKKCDDKARYINIHVNPIKR